MDPRNISISDFTYELSEDRIAAYPLPNRDDSKLLIYHDGTITEDIYRNITAHLPKNSLLVFNNSRVLEARIFFRKETGSVIEIFCLEPHESYLDMNSALVQQGTVFWKCLIGGASKWKKGLVLNKKISTGKETISLEARYIEKRSDYFIIELTWKPKSLSFAELLHYMGSVPLPPYIKRKAEALDLERYQTVYARNEGSVAAPTAGLHFTEAVFNEMDRKNIRREFITLHVGAGTFKPVKSETMQYHEMHDEHIEVSAKLIESLLNHIHDPIIAVGTTSLRTIETLYWAGERIFLNPSIHPDALAVGQWAPYSSDVGKISPLESLEAILRWMKDRQQELFISMTRLLLCPGYAYKIVKALITNFHQPKSTLLLLVASMIGNDWRNVYDYALNHQFRFLSYGDGCLLFTNQM